MPEVTFIIPCFNQAHFLTEAVKSVQDQGFTDWECIIVNDSSPDNTQRVATALTEADQRIKTIITPKNLGLAGARNFGINYASGHLILPLDADDKIAPQYCELAIKAFKDNPSLSVVYCKAELFGNSSGSWNLPVYHYGLLFGRNPLFCSSFFKKSDWEKVNGYDETLKSGLEDWDFWLRILNKDSLVIQLPVTGFYYRQHQQSMIKTLSSNESAYQIEVQTLLCRHITKFYDWSSNHLSQEIEARQIQNKREQMIAGNSISRLLYALAKRVGRL